MSNALFIKTEGPQRSFSIKNDKDFPFGNQLNGRLHSNAG